VDPTEKPPTVSVNKTQVVKAYLASHPKATPLKISAALGSQGIDVSPSYAAGIKSSLKAKKRKKKVASKASSPAAPAEIPSSESGVPWKDQESIQAMFFELQPPDLPDRLSPGQAAQLAEVIEYLTITIRHLLECVREEKGERVSLDACQWQNLVDLQCRLAEYLRKIGEPDSDSP